ncbi:MAG: TonB-dependent receptor plug domain-containing protein [Flavobacteriales bacterium]|nr:TonB-dependent receptor plug domain-containing protein [Flavobacteriales bacterium]
MKLKIYLFTLLLFGLLQAQAQKVTVSGFLKEEGSNESLLGVMVYTQDKPYGAITNDFGFYSITLPIGEYTFIYDYVGYNSKTFQLNLLKDTVLSVFLQSNSNQLAVATVNVTRNKASENVQMSTVDIPIKQIKDIPALFGEKDVLKVIQLMPGVQSGSEGQSGLYVRGGGPDQNLIILDGATVYNAQHLFGFFSLFNGDALRSVELIKGGFPARYGGRLSSVIDMNMKDGNKDHLTGEMGIGIISSRGVIEGPLAKGKGSFIVSGRRTYIDALTQPIILATNNGSTAGYYFYDLNAKLNYKLSDKDHIYLSGYFGRDKFYSSTKNSDNSKFKANFGWGNATTTFRWNHVLNNKMFVNTSAIYSTYDLLIAADEIDHDTTAFGLRYGSGIQDFSLKQDYDWYASTRHKIKFGFLATHHSFTPNATVVIGGFNDSTVKSTTSFKGVETGVYIEDEIKIGLKLTTLLGARLSTFSVGKTNYVKPEPRISAAYKLQKNLSAKASFANMNQYIHLLSNSGIGLPTDLWVPATEKVKPQSSWQAATGIARDFDSLNFTLTVEGYYKVMSNIIGYKEGASFLSVADAFNGGSSKVTWEDNVTNGNGKSYGTEVLFQRKTGKLTGWVGYTLSWTKLQFDSLNFGKEFYAKYDRRHDVSVVAQYKIKKNMTLSATWVYGTGNAITLPLSTYQLSHFQTFASYFNYWQSGTEYSERNAFRMKAYNRADIGLQITKQKKHGEQTWEFSVYNAYNQKNPFYYYAASEDNNDPSSKTVLKQISLFPILPSISWNYKFK